MAQEKVDGDLMESEEISKLLMKKK